MLVVDLQNDFCPGEALPTPYEDRIILLVNKLMDKFAIVIASRDWHSEITDHFNIWSVHYVQGMYGINFPDGLRNKKIPAV